MIRKPEGVRKKTQNAFRPCLMVGPHDSFLSELCFSFSVWRRWRPWCLCVCLLGSTSASSGMNASTIGLLRVLGVVLTRVSSPSSSAFAIRVEWPCASNVIFDPPDSGSRSSVRLGAWAIAVAVACHMPSCGVPLSNDNDIPRARPTMLFS